MPTSPLLSLSRVRSQPIKWKQLIAFNREREKRERARAAARGEEESEGETGRVDETGGFSLVLWSSIFARALFVFFVCFLFVFVFFFNHFILKEAPPLEADSTHPHGNISSGAPPCSCLCARRCFHNTGNLTSSSPPSSYLRTGPDEGKPRAKVELSSSRRRPSTRSVGSRARGAVRVLNAGARLLF